MQSWPHNVFDGSLATGPCSKHWLCTERTVCMSWAMAPQTSSALQRTRTGSNCQTVSASQAKHLRSRDFLSKQLYINPWMCPKPKPQRIYNQKSSTFGASTFLTSQCCKASKCCACHVKLLYLLLRPFEGARKQHVGGL